MQNLGSNTRLHALVTGMVQGVNFRWFTQQRAAALEVVGYVRNRADGSVEVVAEGSPDALKIFLAQVQEGPSHAVVEHVEPRWRAPRDEFYRFEIRD